MKTGLLQLAWPLFISMGLGISLNVTDSFFLSRVSDHAAAAVGGLLPVLLICLSVFVSVGQAGCAVASQLTGARKTDEARFAYSALIALNLASGLVLSSTLWLLSDQIPEWLGYPTELRDHGATYLRWVGGAQFVRAAQFAYTNILNSKGMTRWTLAEGILMNLSNLGFNALFLSGAFGLNPLEFGLRGVAWATVLSTILGLGLSMWVTHVVLGIHLPTELGPAFRRATRRIVAIGAPSALEPMAYQMSQMILISFIVSLGPAALAARTYTANVNLVSVLWLVALGSAVQILVAHRIGETRFDAADAELKRALRWGGGGACAIALCLLCFRSPLVHFFTDDPEVVSIALPLFWVTLFSEPARTANIIAGGALRSSGDARFTALAGAAVMFGFSLPVCYVLGFVLDFGLIGIWVGMGLDEAARGLVNTLRWRSGRWRDFRVSYAPARG